MVRNHTRIPRDILFHDANKHGFARYGDLVWLALFRRDTNTMENFWSLLKRGIIRSNHQVSIKHLDRYLSEFTYRFNRRDEQEKLFEQTTKSPLNGKNLRYKVLTGAEVSES